jgi:hypothetical protein
LRVQTIERENRNGAKAAKIKKDIQDLSILTNVP